MDKKIIEQLANLKAEYQKLMDQVLVLKTEKAREKRRIKMIPIRRQFRLLEHELDLTKFNLKQLGIMAPVGGPYCLVHAKDFKNEGTHYSFDVDGTRYAGYVDLLENKCGIDNLAILIRQVWS